MRLAPSTLLLWKLLHHHQPRPLPVLGFVVLPPNFFNGNIRGNRGRGVASLHQSPFSPDAFVVRGIRSGTIMAAPSAHRDDSDKFHFSIDRGGTFTDVHCILPLTIASKIGRTEIVSKLLSVDPANYGDAPTEGIRRILEEYDDDGAKDGSYSRDEPVATRRIGSIRMGTTVATNALLERKGARTALVITRGFRDLLEIGDQSRPHIFDLSIKSPSLLYENVVEVDERVMLGAFLKEDGEHDDEGRKTDDGADEEDGMERGRGSGPGGLPLPPAGVGPRVVGVTGETLVVMREPDLDAVRAQLRPLLEAGVDSLAVAFFHSFAYPRHERLVGEMARSMGFGEVALSSDVMPMVKIVSRGHTATAAAYLTPSIKEYLTSFKRGFDEGLKDVRLDFMKSDGGLTPVDDFGGHQAILSGPAGGVIGYAKTAYRPRVENDGGDEQVGPPLPPRPVIGFDMGGTSTDVSRYDGRLEHVFETTTAGVAIQAPQLDINTVAAGGGSRLFLRSGLFVVGPESAGAHPGPVCYRKGGHLAVTDANVVLGRVVPEYFPKIFGPDEDEALDLDAARMAFAELAGAEEADGRSVEELAYGFLQVANEAMCRPIRNLTQMKGFDITTHSLACFGGAGPQHACAMAKALGMTNVFVHRHGGVLSAYGLSMADAVFDISEPTAEVFSLGNNREQQRSGDDEEASLKRQRGREDRLAVLAERATAALMAQGYAEGENIRYQGTDNAVMIREPKCDDASPIIPYDAAFRSHYRREFGFDLEGRDILIDDYRVRAVVPGPTPSPSDPCPSLGEPSSVGSARAYFENGWETVPVYRIEELRPGHEITGPSLIIQPISTVVLEIDCRAVVTSDGDLEITVGKKEGGGDDENKNGCDGAVASFSSIPESTDGAIVVREDPVMLSIFAHRFMGIAEQMGRTLARTAISVNIKERLDFSCALFTSDGGLVANAPHIPVHLGAMQSAVTFQVKYWNGEGREGIQEGDVLVSNHPQLAGGSHLPDITVITPVFHDGQIIFFVASRGHHADIGGIAPGSMPPHSKSLEEEGAMIVAFKLVRDGHFQEEGIREILESPGRIEGSSGTRNMRDNLSDLRAQVAANNSGIRLLQHLVKEYGLLTVHSYMKFIQRNAEVAVRSMLKEFASLHGSRAHAIDRMDDGTPIELTIDIDEESGDATFDFTGTGPQVLGNHNAPPAVTYSAVIYALRSLVGQDIPLNQGCLAPVKFIIPKFCLLNPSDDAGVVGGNVLTSQRVVDVVLKAFRACAASQGCMNNLTFGDDEFGYYETIAGGAGAGPGWRGRSGVHTHCTNTRITDPEILERRYPVLLRQFALRNGSGGDGLYRGGDGVVREIEPLRPLVMSILSERRSLSPYGLAGGGEAKRGLNLIVKKGEILVNVGGRCSCTIDVGERLRIETPGGGGYGASVGEPGEVDREGGTKEVMENGAFPKSSSNGEEFFPHGNGSLAEYSASQNTA